MIVANPAGLHAIWFSALTLLAFIAAMVVELLVRRAVRERGGRRRILDRDALLAALLFDGAGPGKDARPFAARGRDAPFEMLLDLLTLVRGRERDRIVAAAEGLGAAEALRGRLRRGRLRSRLLAAETLGYFSGPETTKALDRARRDRDPRVRAAAQRSLVAIGAAPSITSLLDRVSRGGGGRQSALTGALRAAVADQPGESILVLARRGLTPNQRILLMDCLAAARVTAAAPQLRRLAAEGGAEVRAAAMQALGALRHLGGVGEDSAPAPAGAPRAGG